MDPGEPLAAAAERSAGEDLEDGQHLAQRAAVARQHDARPHNHDPVYLRISHALSEPC